MGYFPEEALKHSRQVSNRTFTPLEQIISEFPVQLKKAMLAATEHGYLRANTWSNCAFNAAGTEVSAHVSSYSDAARVFAVPVPLVERFIALWDTKLRLSDTGRAQLLKKCLLNVGVSTPPGKYRVETEVGRDRAPGDVVVIDEMVYKGEQTKFVEALDKAETLEDFLDMGLTEEDLDAANDFVRELIPA